MKASILRTRFVTVLVAIGAIACMSINLWLFKSFTVDDTFITFRYIQQWLHGQGLVYNKGECVEGYSNFLWVMLIAPFGYVDLDLFIVSKVLGLILGVGSVLLTLRFSQRFLIPGLAALFLGATGAFSAWAVSGLETALFAFLLVLASSTFVREEERDRGWVSGLLFGLLALTRPEGVLFGLIAVAFRVWRLANIGVLPPRRDVLRGISLATVFGIYVLWRISYYGYLLPNTVYAKSMGFRLRPLLEGLYYQYLSVSFTGGALFTVVPILVGVTQKERFFWFDYFVVSILAYAGFVTFAGGDWMPFQRFLVHVLPLLFIVVQHGVECICCLIPDRWRSASTMLIVLVQVGYLLTFSMEARFIDRVGSGPLVPLGGATLEYMKDHVDAEDTIAVTDAGLIGYQLPLDVRIVDMVGLNDAHIAHQPVRMPGGLFGQHDAFGKWDVDYVLAREPRYVQVNILSAVGSERVLTNFTGTTELVNDPRFLSAYQMVEGVPGLYVRLDGM